MKLPTVLTKSAERVENALKERLAQLQHVGHKQPLLNAMHYSTLNGGKRFRAALVYATAESTFNNLPDHAIDDMACAVEMIHAYSLIHDDLPAMDDDHYRRGKPSCHIKYGEDIAILAGDTLQVHAFELLSNSDTIPHAWRLTIISTLAKAIGLEGMAGGQAMDVLARRAKTSMSVDYIEETHRSKTARLIQASVMIGAEQSISNNLRLALEKFSGLLGVGFQIKDDLLDWQEEGKQGNDTSQQKISYPTVAGLSAARARLESLWQESLKALTALPKSDAMKDLANYMIERGQ